MKIKFQIYVFLTLLLSFVKVPVTGAEEIQIRADLWAPFNSDPTSDKPGYMIEVASRIFEKAGHKLNYQVMPWNRSIKAAENGEVDGIVGAAVGDAPNFIFPKESLGRVENAIYVKKDNPWRYTGIESLKEVKVGVIADYSYGDILDGYIKANIRNKNLIEVATGDDAFSQNIKKLSLGRVSAIFCAPPVLISTIQELKQNLEDFVQAGVSSDIDDLYIAFSPKKPSSNQYAEILSKGIVEMRKSGELQKILDKYSLKDWK